MAGADRFVPPVPDAPSLSRDPRPHAVARARSIDADAVVIGSGAGGGVAAAVLAAAGKRVWCSSGRRWSPRIASAARSSRASAPCSSTAGSRRPATAGSRSGPAARWAAARSSTGAHRSARPAAVRDEWRAAGVGDDLDEHYAAMESDIGVTPDESTHNGPNGAARCRSRRPRPAGRRSCPRNVRGCGDCGPCAVGCRSGAKQSGLRTSSRPPCDGWRRGPRPDRGPPHPRRGRPAVGVMAAVPGGEITVRAPLVALAGGSILSAGRAPAVRHRHRDGGPQAACPPGGGGRRVSTRRASRPGRACRRA